VSYFNTQYLELISGVKVPIAILGAEIDKLSPPELLKQYEEVLTAKSEVGRLNIFFPFFLSIFGYLFLYAFFHALT